MASVAEENNSETKDERDSSRMTFTAHLGELRTRMLHSIALLFVLFFVCWGFSNYIIEAIASPLILLPDAPVTDAEPGAADTEAPEEGTRKIEWVTLTPLETMLVRLRFSAYGALVIAFPFIVYQICGFIFPGLKPNEKRVVQILLYGCGALALAGAAVAFFGVIPTVMPYLLKFTPDFVVPQLRLGETLSLIMKVILGFTLAFQFPMIVLVLVYMGLLTPQNLKDYRRVAIVGMFVAAALLTPPDPVSLLIMAMPLLLLYEFSIWLSYLVVRRKENAQASD